MGAKSILQHMVETMVEAITIVDMSGGIVSFRWVSDFGFLYSIRGTAPGPISCHVGGRVPG